MLAVPSLTGQLQRYIERICPRTVLLFSRVGYEDTVRFLQEFSSAFPGVTIDLVTYVVISEERRRDLPIREVIFLNKSLIRTWRGLFHVGRDVLLKIRRNRYDLFVGWNRYHQHSPERFVFELLGCITGAGARVFYCDRSGSITTNTWLHWLFWRAPAVLLKVLAMFLGTMLLYPVLAYARARGPRARRHRLAAGKGPLEILFIRSDLELATGQAAVGGSASHVQGLVEAFVDAGHSVTTLSTGRLHGVHNVRESITVDPIMLPDLPREFSELLTGIKLYREALPLLRSRKPDLIYERYSMYGVAGELLGRKLGLPVVLEANNSEVEMRRRFSKVSLPWIAQPFETAILQRADQIVAVAEGTRQTFGRLGIPAAKVEVIPNGVNPAAFHPGVDGSRVREKYHLAGKFVVGFVGLFYPWHGVPFLVQAIQRVAAELPDAHLLLVGDGEEKARVLYEADRLGVMSLITLAGVVPHEEIPCHLAAMDVVVSPHAPWKGFFGSPIKLFEYMAAGKAIVASNVGQIGAVLENERTALLVEPGNVEALTQAIVRLGRSPQFRTMLGGCARAEAVANRSWVAVAQRIVELAGEA